MDGYAVKAADTKNAKVNLEIVGESAAGNGWRSELRKGQAVRIMTGAPVPEGADAVQKLELADEKDGRVRIAEPTEKGRFIVHRGKEVKKGSTVLKKGQTISVENISIPAAFGYAKLKVTKKPRVAILSTGSEIVDISKKPKRDQIRNSNSLMLKALAEKSGCHATILQNTGDELEAIKNRLSHAAKTSDVLITTGGVSVGKYDLTKAALRELGAEIFFERVALKPGKPTVFARLGKTAIFALPGNPVSAAVTFHLFVRTYALMLQGSTCPKLCGGVAVANGGFKGTKERDSYLPGKLGTSREGHLTVTPIGWHGSSDFIGFSRADALVVVKKGSEIGNGDVASVFFI
jgi:molybdenum cofactor synthesis domain-containing protein